MADIKLIVDTKSVDRAIDKINRLRTGVGRTTRTTSSYTRATQQSTASVVNHTKAVENSATAFQRQHRAVTQTKRGTNQLGVMMQQTGYQVGDFAVQVQSGTNAFVAFGQQATQLVGTMGMLSKSTRMIGVFAVLGILIPILTAVAGGFMRARGEAKDFAEELDNLKGVVSDLKDTQNLLGMSTKDLEDKYGDAAEQVREYARVEATLQASLAKSEMEDALSTLKGTTDQYYELQDAGRAYRNTILEIERDFNVLNSEAKILEDSFTALARAETFEGQKNAVDNLLASLESLGVPLGELPKPVAEMLLQFLEANRTFEEAETLIAALKEGIDSSSDSASNLTNQFGNAVDKIRQMSSEIKNFYSELRAGGLDVKALEAQVGALKAGAAPEVAKGEALRTQIMGTDLAREIMSSGGPGEQATFLANVERRVQLSIRRARLQSEISDLTSEDTGGGGGGVDTSVLDKSREEFERLKLTLDSAYNTQQKFKEGQDILDKALSSGVIESTEEYNRLLGLLREEYSLTEDKGNEFAESMKKIAGTAKQQLGDAFMSIVDGTKSAKDAFKDMARAILKQAFDLLVIQPIINGIFGGTGGGGGFFSKIFGSANGNVFSNGSHVKAYANGGVVNGPTYFPMPGNQTGLMGEAGPEAIMPLKRGKNGKLGVQVEGNSGGNVSVQNHFHISANGDDSVKRIIAQEAPRIASLTQKQILDQRRRGGVMKSTFG